MGRMIGMGAKSENAEAGLNPFVEENKSLQAEIEKLRKEKKKVLEENKTLKKEMALLKKETAEEKTVLSVQVEGVE